MSKWETSTGTIQYFDGPPLKCWLLIDPEIAAMWRWFIPVPNRRPMYPPHISIVRKIPPTEMQHWGRHQGKTVGFKYERWLYNDETYWWLNCLSLELEEIRVELGLPPYGLTTYSPDYKHLFHTTVANMKDSK